MKDKIVKKIIDSENKRQKENINLIASENIVSKDVSEALGSCFVNKYAEGLIGNRYYSGNSYVDTIEKLAQKRALKLFGLNSLEWAVNVQPLSGSVANLAILYALVNPGETIMSMSLDHGGHLSHGYKRTLSGAIWKNINYGISTNGLIDYKKMEEFALKNKPAIIIVGGSSYPFVPDFKKIEKICKKINSIFLVDMSHIAGIVASGLCKNPFEHADVVMTTTHKTLRGPRSAIIFSKKDDRNFNNKINKAVFPGIFGGPHINQIAAVAVALKEASSKSFKKYMKKVLENAQIFDKEFTKLGWKNPFRGTNTHMVILDTYGSFGINGKDAATLLEKNNIIVNKQIIPNDILKPEAPSGIRIGTPWVTTQKISKSKIIKIIHNIDYILKNKTN